MKTVKIILYILILISLLFFTTGLVVKESSYSTTITINKPLDKTFQLFTNRKTISNWNPAYTSIELVDEKFGITGSIYHITIKNNNQSVSIKEKVLAYVNNEKITLLFDREGVIEVNDFTFKSVGSKTLITLNSSYQAKSYILGCILPYLKSKFKKINEKSLLNFKNFAENTTL